MNALRTGFADFRTAFATIPPRQRLAAGLMFATCIALAISGWVLLANSIQTVGGAL